MAHRAPVADRHAAVGGHVRDALVRDRIRQVVQPFDRGLVGRIDRAGECRQHALHPARLERVARAVRFEHLQAALRVEAGAHQHRTGRAVEVVHEVFFARPRQLHRPAAGLLRHPHRLRDEVHLEPAPETAAEVGHVQRHRVGRHAGHARRRVARQAGHLRRRPHLDAAAVHARRAVHRLHRRVRQVRRAVQRLDPARRVGQRRRAVAAAVEGEAAAPFGRVARCRFERGFDAFGVERTLRWRAPLHRQRTRGFARMPRGAGNDRERGIGAAQRRQPHDALDARQLQRRVGVDRARCAADHRRVHDAGVQQARQPHVESVHRAPVALVGQVDALRGLADDAHRTARLQDHVAGRCQRGLRDQLAVVRARPRRVADDAVAHLELRHRQLPAQRRHAEQSRARGGGGQAQRLPRIGYAGRSAGHVDAEFARHLQRDPARGLERRGLLARLARVGMERQEADEALGAAEDRVVPGLLQAHAAERHVELVGHQHRQRGVHALAHLAAIHRQHDGAVLGDLDPAVERDLAVHRGPQRGGAQPAARRHQPPADHHRAADGGTRQQQAAPLHAMAMQRVRVTAAPARGGAWPAAAPPP